MSDEFAGESGLKDDWDGTIIEASFQQQGRGNWALVLTSSVDGEDETYTHLPMSVGGADKGWTSHDGGEEIMGATEKQRFHERSSIQQFINAALKAGAEDELRERSAKLFNRRGPMFAALWLGLRFHWDVVKEATQRQNQVTKEWEDAEVSILRPTRYLGKATSTSTPTPLAPASNGEISETDMTDLRLLAMNHEEWGDFCDSVMKATDTTGTPYVKNPAIRKNLSKKDWYESLRKG